MRTQIKAIFFDWNGTCSNLTAMTAEQRSRFRFTKIPYKPLHLQLPPDILSTLVQAEPWPDCSVLKSFPIQCIALTNNSIAMIRNNIVPSVFSSWYSADDCKRFKPDPMVYLSACFDLQLSPIECMMVAAHNFDLDAARKVGMRTAFIERPGEDAFEFYLGHPLIKSFEELGRLV